MVVCLAKETSNYLQYNRRKNAMDAAHHGIGLLDAINGRGGLICIDRKGRIGHAFNSQVMTFHWIE